MELRDRVYDFLYGLSDGDLRDIHNDYIDSYDFIEYTDSLDDILWDTKPSDILREYHWIDLNSTYISFYGETCFNYITDYCELDEFVDYAIDNNEDFGYSDLRDILDEGDDESDISNYEDLDDEARFEDEY